MEIRCEVDHVYWKLRTRPGRLCVSRNRTLASVKACTWYHHCLILISLSLRPLSNQTTSSLILTVLTAVS
eukprot:590038-Rhodomonas_salina.1